MSGIPGIALAALVGISGGIAVGGGMVALLVVLDIIPRLAQLSHAFHQVHVFETAVVAGVMFWTFADFMDWGIRAFPLLTSFTGLLAGIFVGMLAGALTEVLNVLPITAKRLGLHSFMVWLVMAMVLGKIAGSLFDFLVYTK